MTVVENTSTTSAPPRHGPEFYLTSISLRLNHTEADGLAWDLNHPYVETFWLPVIGPTSTLMLRFVGRHVPSEDYKLFDPAEIAVCLGVSAGTGRNSPFAKTIKRLTYFDLAAIDSADDDTDFRVTFPSTVPEVPWRKQKNWPEYLRIMHSRATARQHIDAGREPGR